MYYLLQWHIKNIIIELLARTYEMILYSIQYEHGRLSGYLSIDVVNVNHHQ